MKEFKVSRKHESIFDLFKLILGILALVIGIAGIALPILPGWLLVFVGLELLGIKIVFIDRLKEYAKEELAKAKRRGK